MDSRDAAARTEQRREALTRATRIRQSRARLKRRIAEGDVSVSEVLLLAEPEVESMAIGTLLLSQRFWGQERCRKFLKPTLIEETKTIGSMTERQRVMLATVLGSGNGRRR